MKVSEKKKYQEFVEYIEFPTMVYIYETGRLIASNYLAKVIIGESCKNVNLLWANHTKLKLPKEVIENGSRVYYNKKMMNGKEEHRVDIEVNSFIVDHTHIIFCFFEESYKQQFSRYLSIDVPRLFWKNQKLQFLGGNKFCFEKIEQLNLYEQFGKADRSEADTRGEQLDSDVIKSGANQYGSLEQIYSQTGQEYFSRMNRMPLLNKEGGCVGILCCYTLILDREQLREVFGRCLHENSILNEAISRFGTIVVCLSEEEDWPIKYVSGNFSKLGYEVGEIYDRTMTWKQLVHPDDYSLFLQKGKEKKDEKQIVEYRVRKADGNYIWLQDEMVSITKNGKDYYREGIITPIGEENQTDSSSEETNIHIEKQKTFLDFLTGIPNRLKYENDIEIFVKKAVKQNKNGYILIFDLDDFKHINEGLGTEYGDILLKKIAEVIDEIPQIQNHCYRIDGDEFLILVDCQYEDEIDHIVEKLYTTFNGLWDLQGKECYCTMSMGVAKFPADATTGRELMKCASTAAYDAKNKGKNRYVYYRNKAMGQAMSRLNYEKHLRKAIAKGCLEFCMYYQPIVKSNGKRVADAEALLRWRSKELGFVNPSQFIPLSEYLGLIVPLGEYVFKEAFTTCRKWNEIDEDFSISVNVSVIQLVQPNIVERILEIARLTRVNTKNIILEVTESLAVEDMALMKSVLIELKSNGFRIALDDFGTGYSSLNHIMEMPLDFIKIDRSFISNYGTKEFKPSLLSAITELAHSMDIEIIVEGVETKQQMEFLMFLTIDKYQGFYYGRPIEEEVFYVRYLKELEED